MTRGRPASSKQCSPYHQSTSLPLDQAFSGDWQGRELVHEGAERPVVEFTAQLAASPGSDITPLSYHASPGSDITPLSYHLEVEFMEGEQRSCRWVEEWSSDDQRTPIPNTINGWTGLFYRSKLKGGAERDRFDAIAERIGRASLYRFDPQLMAIPASFDTARKFRMDPDGFGLATLLDDIVGFDPQKFINLSGDFCKFFPQFRRVRIETQSALVRKFEITGRHSTGAAIGKGIVFETSQGRAIRASQASDGAVLFLGLLALIYSPEAPALLLIEEPEKGVYPKRLEEVIQLIRDLQDASSGRTVPQIIMTTHSPYLLTSFEPEEVTLMVREGESGRVRARPLRDAPNIQERLGHGEFYLGELWYNLTEAELFADA